MPCCDDDISTKPDVQLVRKAEENIRQALSDLAMATLEIFNEAVDIVVPIKSTATAAGLNPTETGTLSRGLAAVNVVTALGGAFGEGERAAARLTTGQAADLAGYLGFSKVKGAPFNSHGQAVFGDGKRFITLDIDSHQGATWKIFSRKGVRLGSYDELLTTRIAH